MGGCEDGGSDHLLLLHGTTWQEFPRAMPDSLLCGVPLIRFPSLLHIRQLVFVAGFWHKQSLHYVVDWWLLYLLITIRRRRIFAAACGTKNAVGLVDHPPNQLFCNKGWVYGVWPQSTKSVYVVQGGWCGWPTGNGKKLSSSQAQLGQATCLAVA